MLIRHSAVYVAAKLLPGIVGMAATALLTRLMDPASYGLYGLALVVMTLGSAGLFDWLGLAYLRLGGGRADQGRVAATILALFAVLVALSALAALIAWLCGLWRGPAAAPVAAGLVLMWCYAGFELASRFHVAGLRPARYLAMNLGRAVLAAAGACGAAWLTHSPAYTTLGTAAGTLGGVALAIRRWPSGRPDRALARELLAFGLPLAASLALIGLATSGTRALVEILGSAEELGLYTAAFLLVQNTLSVAASGIASAGFSLAVRAVDRSDTVAADHQLRANCGLLLAVLAPMAAGMTLTAPEIAAAMVGSRYVAAVATLTPWLAAAGFFAGMRAHFLDHAFHLGKRPDLQFRVTAAASAIAMGLTAALVPRLGAMGAAIGLAVAMAISCVHAAISGRRAWRLPLPAEAVIKVALACALMAVAVHFAPGGLPGKLAAGVASYGVAALALGVLAGNTRHHAVAAAAQR